MFPEQDTTQPPGRPDRGNEDGYIGHIGPECGTFDFGCQAEDAASRVFGSAIEDLAAAISEGLGQMVASASTLWVRVGTPNLTGGGGSSAINPGEVPPESAQITTVLSWVMWIGLAIAILSLIAMGTLLAVRMSRGEGAASLGRLGLVMSAVIMISGASSVVAALVPSQPPGGVSGPVATLQSSLWWYMAAAATVSIIIGGLKMAWEQRAQPGKQVLQGVLTLIVVAGAGVTIISILLVASDAYAVWLLNRTLDCDVATDEACFGQSLMGILSALGAGSGMGPILVIVLGLFGLLITALQVMLMVARGGMLVILAGVLPLAAALTTTESGKQWFNRCIGWTVALLLYKPAAAMVYVAAFELVRSSETEGILSALTGLMLMVIALVALPALMKFVTPMVSSMTSGASSGALAAAAIPTGAAMVAGRGAEASSARGAAGVPGATGPAAAQGGKAAATAGGGGVVAGAGPVGAGVAVASSVGQGVSKGATAVASEGAAPGGTSIPTGPTGSRSIPTGSDGNGASGSSPSPKTGGDGPSSPAGPSGGSNPHIASTTAQGATQGVTNAANEAANSDDDEGDGPSGSR